MDKPYARKMELVTRHWSGKDHAVVSGINLITLLWTDGDRHVPVDYRFFDKARNSLTKNDHFQAMLREAHARGFEPAGVVFDSWYSGLENLKLIKTEVVEQLSDELKRLQQRPSALEKHATESCDAYEIAHELLGLFVRSKVLLDQAIGVDRAELDKSVSIANLRTLRQIFNELGAMPDEERMKAVRARLESVIANEERQQSILQLVRTEAQRGLSIVQQIIEYSKVGHPQPRQDWDGSNCEPLDGECS